MSREKRFILPKSLQNIEIKNGRIKSGMKITKHNVIRILEGLSKKNRKYWFHECYNVLKGMYRFYSKDDIKAEMQTITGWSVNTIKRELRLVKREGKKLDKLK
jgi:hypothetical protein